MKIHKYKKHYALDFIKFQCLQFMQLFFKVMGVHDFMGVNTILGYFGKD
jgi:hypothetical protein